MLFESTSLLLQGIVHSLEGDGVDNWDDHLEYGNQCIYELFQMSRPDRQKYGGHVATVFQRASRAIPHVRLMNRAIRQRDRATAIECGRVAISEMNGMEHSMPPLVGPADSAGVVEKASAERIASKPSRFKKLKTKRAEWAKRRSARAS